MASKGIMKAMTIHDFGGPEVLRYEEVPIPEIGPDECLVRVHSCGVNPIDWKVRQGYTRGRVQYHMPLILGWDVSGTVEEVGPLVKRFKKGDKIFARPATSKDGGYAEFVAVKSMEMAFAPKTIPLEHAAGVPLAGQTAWAGLFEIGSLRSGQSVLIHGASGGVGSFAVQFAKIAGARVIATTSTKNVELVHSLGADQVIDYSVGDFRKVVSEMDMVYDTVGGDTQARSWEMIKKGGMLVATVGVDENAADAHGVIGRSYLLTSNGSRLRDIRELIDAGKVRVIIEKEYPLTDAKEAHVLSQAGHASGKIILRIG
ncbi:MAG TPA: NADP-dependent oxidoreductase [Methanomassiliicoccales archaeon]|jgi:NADPH:quinone reductase-like Zn-dependent oxidoreductase